MKFIIFHSRLLPLVIPLEYHLQGLHDKLSVFPLSTGCPTVRTDKWNFSRIHNINIIGTKKIHHVKNRQVLQVKIRIYRPCLVLYIVIYKYTYFILVQLTGLVEVTSSYFLTGRCHSSNGLTIVKKKTVCNMGQTGQAEFIRLISF